MTAPGPVPSDETVTAAVRSWLETVVVGLNLCPFANRELARDSVRFVVTSATTPTELLESLADELALLETDPGTETTLLVHPQVLQDFSDYNDFLDDIDDRLLRAGLDGTYQVASFHPQYQFAGTDPDDSENFTNRSPYPLLHLLRESSVERAIRDYPDVDGIPERNIATMNALDRATLARLFGDV